MNKITLENLLKDGFTERRAKYYLSILESEKKSGLYSEEKLEWAHERGFTARSAVIFNLNDENINDYLSDYEYNLIFPLNAWQRIWVNDKLSLKMILNGTEYGKLMPEYYYYSSPNGLLSLMDNPFEATPQDFLKSLRYFGTFACKPNNGSTSIGFCKMSCQMGKYYLNDSEVSENDILQFVKNQTNYLYTEYIYPHSFYKQFSPLIHTLRLNTLNINGNNPRIINGYLRLPTKQAKNANYLLCNSYDIFNLTSDVNPDTGAIGKSLLVYGTHTMNIDRHPDNEIPLNFTIENFDILKNQVLGMCTLLNSIEYIGFDIGITDKGFKIMEINTHPGIEFGQLMCPIMKHPIYKNYFKSKIDTIINLDTAAKNKRNCIQR